MKDGQREYAIQPQVAEHRADHVHEWISSPYIWKAMKCRKCGTIRAMS